MASLAGLVSGYVLGLVASLLVLAASLPGWYPRYVAWRSRYTAWLPGYPAGSLTTWPVVVLTGSLATCPDSLSTNP